MNSDERSSFPVYALLAKQADLAEKTATAFSQQRKALLRDHAEDPLVKTAVWMLDESESDAKRVVGRLKRGLDRQCPCADVMGFVDDTHGLGKSVHFFLGLLPQWVSEFGTVSKLWAYCGLHVVDGKAPKRRKGQKANWSGRLKSIAIKYMAEPCIKSVDSPYRAVYDARRAHTTETHPEWSDGHSHNDALRITAKDILKDLWRVSRGHTPLLGRNHIAHANHVVVEPTGSGISTAPGGAQVISDDHYRDEPAGAPPTDGTDHTHPRGEGATSTAGGGDQYKRDTHTPCEAPVRDQEAA